MDTRIAVDQTNDSDNELDQPFSRAEIESAVSKLLNDKCPGPDGIPAEFDKVTPNECIGLIKEMFNRILDTGTFPKGWVKSLVTTYHKSGPINDSSNYKYPLQSIFSFD